MKRIDLRSDTVTLPTEAMREAIHDASLGDDVYGEDPATGRLEEMAASMAGKDAGLLVPSGTMANLICLLSHCGRGDEIILGDQAHIFYYEAGGMAALGGIVPHTVFNQADGTMRLEDIERAIRGDDFHFPRSRLVCLENTHNRCNGSPLSPEYSNAVIDLARRHGLAVHLDGARIFNAAVALGVDASELACGFDSVAFCLSKGLAVPIGSLVCGSYDFIEKARRIRKILGGGMRQTGIIAAAGIVALEEMVGRLAEDHANARRLAEGIEAIPGLSVDLERVKTNIVFFNLDQVRMSEEMFMDRLAAEGLGLLHLGPFQFRMVTHYGVDRKDVDAALEILRETLAAR